MMSPLWAAGGERTGDQTEHEFLSFFLFFFACVCSLWLTKTTAEKVFLLLSGFRCVTECLHGCWASFPVGQIPTRHCWPKCDVLFFPWDFKVKVMSHKFLIYFQFIDGDREVG